MDKGIIEERGNGINGTIEGGEKRNGQKGKRNLINKKRLSDCIFSVEI